MEYINIEEKDITCELFTHFNRHQVVTKCWRKIDGKWCIKNIEFVEEWGQTEFEFLVKCLKNTVKTGGLDFFAFFRYHIFLLWSISYQKYPYTPLLWKPTVKKFHQKTAKVPEL